MFEKEESPQLPTEEANSEEVIDIILNQSIFLFDCHVKTLILKYCFYVFSKVMPKTNQKFGKTKIKELKKQPSPKRRN